MIIFKKYGLVILITAIGCMVMILGIFCVLYKLNQPRKIVSQPMVVIDFCGTPNLNEKAIEGKQIFNSYCSACHKLNSKTTGPALKSIDSIKYWKFVIQKKAIIDSTKFGDLGIDYHQGYFVDHVSNEDFKKVYDYIK